METGAGSDVSDTANRFIVLPSFSERQVTGESQSGGRQYLLRPGTQGKLTDFCRLRLKRDGTRAENRFRLSAERTSTFKSAKGGVSSVDYWRARCAHQR